MLFCFVLAKFWDYIFIFFILSCLQSAVAVSQVIVHADSWVDIGEDTTLTCTVSETYSTLEWRLSNVNVTDIVDTDSILTIIGSSVYYSPTIDQSHYVFDNTHGNNALTVKSVTLDDDKKYWCRVFLPGLNPVDSFHTRIRGMIF